MNLALWLQRRAVQSPTDPAIFHGTDLICDYAGFWGAACGVGQVLAAHGIQSGDRVAIFLKNCPEYLPILYGIWAIGAVAVPINSKLHPREVGYILDNSASALCISNDAIDGAAVKVVTASVITSHQGAAELRMAPRAPDDLAWLFYTSGTTGRPKGVMISHQMLRDMTLSYFVDVDDVTAKDCTIYAAPMSHGAGLYNLMHVLRGARHVIPKSGGFDEDEVFQLARHFDRAHMFAAPTMVKRMVEAAKRTGDRGAGLRTVVYAGGPMYLADIIEASEHFGPIFAQIYGQGECPMCITALTKAEVMDRTHPNWRDRLASVGRAQSVVEVRVVDENGADCPNGVSGEVIVKGGPVMLGYWQNEAANQATLRDGWLYTGDVGALDADGYLTLKDRSKDVIISGGTNIYPREVEEILLEHPAVSEVSVLGQPNPEWGEDVVAFVVLSGSVDHATLDGHCTANIARFKRPKAYYVVSELPKNNYGKVLKTELRERLPDKDSLSKLE